MTFNIPTHFLGKPVEGSLEKMASGLQNNESVQQSLDIPTQENNVQIQSNSQGDYRNIDFTKLVSIDRPLHRYELSRRARVETGRLFGVEFGLYQRLFKGKGKSQLFTFEELVKRLAESKASPREEDARAYFDYQINGHGNFDNGLSLDSFNCPDGVTRYQIRVRD